MRFKKLLFSKNKLLFLLLFLTHSVLNAQYDCNQLVDGYYTSLQNGSFENGTGQGNGAILTDASTIDNWNSTASDNLIDIWKDGHYSLTSYNGDYYTELNASYTAALYQDITTAPGDVMEYSFAHRGRDGTDQIEVQIGPASGTLVAQQTYSTGPGLWVVYTGTYTVPAGQTVTRFQLYAKSTASNNPGAGNFLDAVVFQSQSASCASLIDVNPEVCNNSRDDDNDGIVDCSDGDCSNYVLCRDYYECNELYYSNYGSAQNSSFSTYTGSIPDNSFSLIDDGYVDGWTTTATDGKIEVWDSDPDGVFSYEGKTHIELNGTEAAALYQDVLTKPLDTLVYAFAHRGISGNDEVRLLIGDASASPLTAIDTVSTDASGWVLYQGTYIVPAGQVLTRIQFEAVSSSGANLYDGNYLDAIQFYATRSSCSLLTRNEIYNNSIDDDGDGKIDCDDPDCHYISYCQKPFSCDPDAYLFQNQPSDVYNVDLASGTYVVEASDITPSNVNLNGMGYNTTDGHIWGNFNKIPYYIAKVDSTFNVDTFFIDGLPDNNYYVGDVDTTGIMYLYSKGNFALIDVNPNSDDYLKYLGYISTELGSIHDFAFNTKDGYLYSVVKKTNHLLRIDISDGSFTNLGEIPILAGNNTAYGAIYMAGDGSMYISANNNGYIYKVDSTQNIVTNNDIVSNIFAFGPSSGKNDGAFCALAEPPQEICGNGIDDDGDGLVDCDDPACTGETECLEICGNGFDDDGDGDTDCDDSDCYMSMSSFDRIDTDYYDAVEDDKEGIVTTSPFDEAEDNWGVSWGDYDGDGYPDVFLTSYQTDAANFLFKNEGDGSFSKVITGNIVTDLASSIASAWADYDNDGDLDLYVGNNIGYKNFLYRNNGDGTFTSISNDPVVNFDGYSHGVSWADYDNDGYLDLFVADFFSTKFNKLFKNNGDGTFSEDTTSPISTEANFSVAGVWGDYDNDGDPDLFIANNEDENNSLYRNDGNGDFTLMSGMDPSSDGGKTTGASWADLDNDMDLDLVVSNAGDQDNYLYINNDGVLERDTTVLPGRNVGVSHGSTWGDFNNDGHIDLYVGNDYNTNNAIYRNDGDGTFTKIFGNTAATEFGNSFGVAHADYDGDGRLDIAIANHSDQANFLYKNTGNGCSNSAACIKLIGTNSNRNGVGAKVKVKATIHGSSIWQMREVSSQTGAGLSGQNDYAQHFGLGNASTIDSIIVEWPSGYNQILTNQSFSTCITITEDSASEICGKVYHDANGNCVQDGDEPRIPNMRLTVQPGNRSVVTDENGVYTINVEPGSYTITQNTSGSHWDATCSTTHNVTVVGLGNQYCGNNFSNSSSCSLPDLSVELSATAHRVGFENLMALTYRNDGVETATGVTVNLTLNGNVIAKESSIAWDSYVNDVITWNLSDLAIGEAVTIYIVDSISTDAVIGNDISIVSTISCTEGDCDTSDDTHVSTQEAVGAIDPNDILVWPVGYVEKDEHLTYKIRFQNVGNAMVTTVIIEDQLPEELDIQTLQLGVASHPYRFSIEENNRLVWTFENINMPDSLTNEPRSHGFVTFRIKPVPGIADQESIENTAAIYFDNLDPLITNTVVNIVGRPPNAIVEAGQLHVYPNPMSEEATIRIIPLQRGTVNIQAIYVYDLMGSVVYEHFGVAAERVQVPKGRLGTGHYFIKAIGEDGKSYSGKVIVK